MAQSGGHHIVHRVGPVAEAEKALHQPDDQRRRHAAHSGKAGAHHADEPGAGGAVFPQSQHPAEEEGRFGQDEEGGDELKPAHAPHADGGKHQGVGPGRGFAAGFGDSAEEQSRQCGQKPGPQTPVDVLHPPLHPGGQQHGGHPAHGGGGAEDLPQPDAQAKADGIKQHAVGGVEHPFPGFAAVLPDGEHLVQHPEAQALKPGLVGVAHVLVGGDGGVFPVHITVFGVAEFAGIAAQKAPRGALVLLHLQNAGENQRLGVVVPETGEVGVLVVHEEGQNDREDDHRQGSGDGTDEFWNAVEQVKTAFLRGCMGLGMHTRA